MNVRQRPRISVPATPPTSAVGPNTIAASIATATPAEIRFARRGARVRSLTSLRPSGAKRSNDQANSARLAIRKAGIATATAEQRKATPRITEMIVDFDRSEIQKNRFDGALNG